MNPVTVVFVMMLHVTAMTKDYYALPDNPKYQRAYLSKPACDEAAKPLTSQMQEVELSIVEFKGVVCKRLEVKQ